MNFPWQVSQKKKRQAAWAFIQTSKAKEECPTGNESSKRIRGRRLLKWSTIKYSQYTEDSFPLRGFCLSFPYWRNQRYSIYRVKFGSRIPPPFLQPTKGLQLQNKLLLSLLTTCYSQKHDIDIIHLLQCYKDHPQLFLQWVNWKMHNSLFLSWLCICRPFGNFFSSIQDRWTRNCA